jgi:hypothetical protein
MRPTRLAGTLLLLLALGHAGCGGDTGVMSGPPDSGGDGGAGGDGAAPAHFSFFYTSLAAMQRLSGSSNGFGGDLRFGMPTGIEGADKICQTIGEGEGFADRTWRAFLSALQGPDGQRVNAIDRIGDGPWYDRNGRLIAPNKQGLLAERPLGDPAAVNDLPDETGQGTMRLGTSYEALTGSTTQGTLFNLTDARTTCMDWTNAALEAVAVIVGHAWPFGGGGSNHWIQAHPERTCVAGVNLSSNGASDGSSIGAGGGWGGIYCFALTP